MTRFEDPVRVVVPHALAGKLVAACTADMDGHLWDACNVERARDVLAGEEGRAVVAQLSR